MGVWYIQTMTAEERGKGIADQFGEHSLTGAGEAVEVVPSPAAIPAVTLPSQASLGREQDRLKGLEDRILERSLTTVEDASYWDSIEPNAVEPPAEWVAELGAERAAIRMRVARAAWLGAKDAPVGLGMARTTSLGILKVRSMVKATVNQLNVQFVSFPAPLLPVMDLESE